MLLFPLNRGKTEATQLVRGRVALEPAIFTANLGSSPPTKTGIKLRVVGTFGGPGGPGAVLRAAV